MDFSKLLQDNLHDTILLIGNGVNRFGQHDDMNSWSRLLLNLWNQYTNPPIPNIPNNFSLPEFFNIMELRAKRNGFHFNYQEEFCHSLLNWHPADTHIRISNWAVANRVPILTTNFDRNLSDAVGCKRYRMQGGNMSSFYPWDRYYGLEKLSNVDSGFGIWHLHGMMDYSQSLRLGLTHYLSAVSRAKKFLRDIRNNPLLLNQQTNSWDGSSTWLRLFFTKPVIIFGLGLESSETFLRWLLIERWRFFLEHPRFEKNAWYICPNDEVDKGKTLFLFNIGISELYTENYNEIYLEPWK